MYLRLTAAVSCTRRTSFNASTNDTETNTGVSYTHEARFSQQKTWRKFILLLSPSSGVVKRAKWRLTPLVRELLVASCDPRLVNGEAPTAARQPAKATRIALTCILRG